MRQNVPEQKQSQDPHVDALGSQTVQVSGLFVGVVWMCGLFVDVDVWVWVCGLYVGVDVWLIRVCCVDVWLVRGCGCGLCGLFVDVDVWLVRGCCVDMWKWNRKMTRQEFRGCGIGYVGE